VIDISAIRDDLLARANVVGVGIGYKTTNGEVVRDEDGNPVECVVVSVTQKVPLPQLAPQDVVPGVVDGDETDVVETGPISVVASMPAGETAALDPRQRHRPIVPGLSVGLNPGVTAGTLGFVVQRGTASARYLLSNWHVIAASNVPVGERDVVTVTQPGNADGGRAPADVVARLVEFVPITSGGGTPIPDPSDCGVASVVARLANLAARAAGSRTRLLPVVPAAEVAAEGDNLVDAAIALIEADYDRTTPEIGVVTETAAPTLGMRVQKFGRTTEHTTGTITQVSATFIVQGYPDGPATFVDQVAVTGDSGEFLAGGDSGSGLATIDGVAVGLCFAGSAVIGIANTWPNVEAALDVRPAQS
jgi:hypothetical protein